MFNYLQYAYLQYLCTILKICKRPHHILVDKFNWFLPICIEAFHDLCNSHYAKHKFKVWCHRLKNKNSYQHCVAPHPILFVTAETECGKVMFALMSVFTEGYHMWPLWTCSTQFALGPTLAPPPYPYTDPTPTHTGILLPPGTIQTCSLCSPSRQLAFD